MIIIIDTVNKTGDTPLSLASANGHLDTVKYLVEIVHCDPRSECLIIGKSGTLSLIIIMFTLANLILLSSAHPLLK